MNRLELLLGAVCEEACEVGQIANKNIRFGMHEIFPDQPFTNAERMHMELDDLQAVIELLNEEYGLDYTPNRECIESKKQKINYYAEYSKKLGLLSTTQADKG